VESRQSLVLITVDCLRADHVGFYGYSRHTTPFLDSLSTESFVFANAIVGGAPTYYSFPAMMASRHPLALGRDVVGLAPGESTLATLLKESGYATAAFLGGNPYLSPTFGYHEGFDVFHDWLDAQIVPNSAGPAGDSHRGLRGRLNQKLEKVSRRLGPLGAAYDELYFRYCQRTAPPATSLDALRRFPAADALVDQACSWVASIGSSPFFLWLHFMDPHSPYYPLQRALDLMGKGRMDAGRARYLNSYWNRSDLGAHRLARHREELTALYDAGIRWVDEQVKRLVEFLCRLQVWNNCLFGITADHGEEFLDHGGRYHPPSKVTEELIRVPLLLRMPGSGGGRVKSVFSLIDLAPTLLQSLNAPLSSDFHGQSRWRNLRDRQDWDATAIVECVTGCSNPFRPENRLAPRIMAVREPQFKLVVDFRSAKEELFDLVADPREMNPLPLGAERAMRRRLLERAREHVAMSMQSRDGGRRLAAQLREFRRAWTHPVSEVSA
jgi:arylsulfatase A-like enzyme